MLSKARIGLTALLAVGFSAFSSVASAGYIETVQGNDCSGVYGTFPNCVVNGTPIIIKIGFGEATEINPLFPTIDGSEFSIVGDAAGTGTWTYTPGPGDPTITHFVAKGGPNFNLFSNLGDPNSDDWFTPTNPNNNQPFGLSHLSFYDLGGDQGPGKVPEPTTMLLLGAGLLAVGIARRRARRD